MRSQKESLEKLIQVRENEKDIVLEVLSREEFFEGSFFDILIQESGFGLNLEVEFVEIQKQCFLRVDIYSVSF